MEGPRLTAEQGAWKAGVKGTFDTSRVGLPGGGDFKKFIASIPPGGHDPFRYPMEQEPRPEMTPTQPEVPYVQPDVPVAQPMEPGVPVQFASTAI